MVARLEIRPRGDGKNATSLLLPNGSRIVGLPGTEATIRGFSAVSLLVIDEAARVPDAVYKALRPMLAASDGDLWLLSTPFGKGGFFWENWERGGEEWERTAAPATECPRISEAFLAEERRQLGEIWFRQEYLCVYARWTPFIAAAVDFPHCRVQFKIPRFALLASTRACFSSGSNPSRPRANSTGPGIPAWPLSISLRPSRPSSNVQPTRNIYRLSSPGASISNANF